MPPVPGRTERNTSSAEGEKKNTSHFRNWGAQEKTFLVQHLGSTPQGESSICKKHLLEAQRHHSTPNFIPKWKGTHTTCNPKQKCNNPKCIQPVCDMLIKPQFESIDKLEITLGVKSSADIHSARGATMKYTKYSALQHHACLVVLFPKRELGGTVTAQMQLQYPNTYGIPQAVT